MKIRKNLPLIAKGNHAVVQSSIYNALRKNGNNYHSENTVPLNFVGGRFLVLALKAL